MSVASQIQRINTAVADAYDSVETMGGTLPATQNVANLADAIETIPSGGTVYRDNDVNFYLPNGDIVYSCSKDDALADGWEMPDQPTIEGLTSQGWNFTKQEIVNALNLIGFCEVGGIYKPSDGKTRLCINIDAIKDFTMTFSQTVANGVEVDWGDGSQVETFSHTSTTAVSHTYSTSGDFVIKFNVTNGTMTLGYRSNLFSNKEAITSLYVGDNITFGWGCFDSCQNLEYVYLCNGFKIGVAIFANCGYLRALILPRNSYSNTNNWCYRCYSLAVLSIPSQYLSTLTSGSQFCECRSLHKISLYESTQANYSSQSMFQSTGVKNAVVVNVMPSGYYYCYSLKNAKILNGVTTLGACLFQGCVSLEKIKFPVSITQINNQVFYSCTSLVLADFRESTSVVAISNINVFAGTNENLKIVVPDALYSDWISATNWSDSSIVNKIVRASDYTGE